MKKIIIIFILTLGIRSAAIAQTTWAEHVAPILYNSCTNCHISGGIAPFSLVGYSNAATNANGIADATQKRRMPPWPANSNYKRYAHERILSVDEIKTLQDWVAQGSKSGDISKAPADPKPNTGAVTTNPDLKLKMPNYTVNTSTDEYRCFVLPTGITVDQFVTAIEVVPGNRQIVHHVLVFQDTSQIPVNKDKSDPAPGYLAFGGTGSNTSQLIGVYVPGQEPYQFPSGFGARILKNSNIIIQVHYPAGIQNQLDSTKVLIKLNNGSLRPMIITPAINHNNSSLTNGPLYIPADQTKTFYSKTLLNFKLSVFAVAPHMHLIGKSIKAYNVNGKDTIPFVDIPNWDFHWQRTYVMRTPTIVEKGSTMWGEAYYDNTAQNRNNPNTPPQSVSLGEGTKDEMMLVYFWLTTYMPGDESMVIDNSALKNISAVIKPEAQSLKLYPNPSHNLIRIANIQYQSRFVIFDLTGKTMSKGDVSTENPLVDISDLTNGTYFLQVVNVNGQTTTQQIIKQ